MPKQSVSIFRATAHALHLTGFFLGSFGNKQKLKIAGFFASLPFPTYLCNKRLKSSIHCVQLYRKIAQIVRVLSK